MKTKQYTPGMVDIISVTETLQEAGTDRTTYWVRLTTCEKNEKKGKVSNSNIHGISWFNMQPATYNPIILLDICYPILVTRYLITDCCYLVLVTWFLLPFTWYSLPETCILVLDSSYFHPNTCFLINLTQYLNPNTSYFILVTWYVLPFTC